jgi:hypothetical protein
MGQRKLSVTKYLVNRKHFFFQIVPTQFLEVFYKNMTIEKRAVIKKLENFLGFRRNTQLIPAVDSDFLSLRIRNIHEPC